MTKIVEFKLSLNTADAKQMKALTALLVAVSGKTHLFEDSEPLNEEFKNNPNRNPYESQEAYLLRLKNIEASKHVQSEKEAVKATEDFVEAEEEEAAIAKEKEELAKQKAAIAKESKLTTDGATLEEIRVIIKEKKDLHRDAMKEKLTSLGAKNATKLDPSQYADFMNFLKAL